MLFCICLFSCIGRPIEIEKFLERVDELEKDSGLLYSDEYEVRFVMLHRNKTFAGL